MTKEIIYSPQFLREVAERMLQGKLACYYGDWDDLDPATPRKEEAGATWGRDFRLEELSRVSPERCREQVAEINARGIGLVNGLPRAGFPLVPEGSRLLDPKGVPCSERGAEAFEYFEEEPNCFFALKGDRLYLISCNYSAPPDYWLLESTELRPE